VGRHEKAIRMERLRDKRYKRCTVGLHCYYAIALHVGSTGNGLTRAEPISH
jgi:hypothetical protein